MMSYRTFLCGGGFVLLCLNACFQSDRSGVPREAGRHYPSTGLDEDTNAAPGTPSDRAMTAADAQLELNPNPRIVSLIPSATELLYSLGRGELLVGRSAQCNYPNEVDALPSVGQGMSPDLEAILALRPELVLIAPMQEDQPVVHRLRGQGIEVMALPDARLSDVGTSLRMLGSRLNRLDEAIELNRGFERRLQALELQAQRLERPASIVAISRSPIFVAGPESRVGRLLQIAGGSNAQGHGDWVSLDAETLATTEVSIILDTSGEQDLSWWNQWTTLEAVRSERICSIEPDIIARPTLRLAEGAEAFARCLHPGVFATLETNVL